MNEDAITINGLCNICGHKGKFSGPLRGARDAFACPACNATLRYREQAAAILAHFGRGRHHFLRRFVRSPEAKKIYVYEAALKGPLHRVLTELPYYTQSYFVEGAALGATIANGIVCQNLEMLTFASNSFDLVVTSDVLEHVENTDAAIEEVFRVLRYGGAHIFSIPLKWPLPDVSSIRAKKQNGNIVHMMEAHYHNSPEGGKTLVITDFGADLLDAHMRVGFRAKFRRGQALVKGLHRCACVVAVKGKEKLGDQVDLRRR